MTEVELLRKNHRRVKLLALALLLMNTHLVKVTIELPLEVCDYAATKAEKTGEGIEKQVEKAMVLMQTIEMILNGVKTSGL